jgi:hypothetical protein
MEILSASVNRKCEKCAGLGGSGKLGRTNDSDAHTGSDARVTTRAPAVCRGCGCGCWCQQVSPHVTPSACLLRSTSFLLYQANIPEGSLHQPEANIDHPKAFRGPLKALLVYIIGHTLNPGDSVYGGDAYVSD